MNAQACVHPGVAALSFEARIDAACERACASIAPAWPLDRSIAVNPHWKRVARPVREVAARLACLAGIAVFPPRSDVRRAWQSGRITLADLQIARSRMGQGLPMPELGQCLAALDEASDWPRLPLLIDVLDNDIGRVGRLTWRQAITHQVSQTCASYFDVWQSDWQPQRSGGLYAFWRDTLTHDHGIGLLMGLPHLREGLRALPASGAEAERWVLGRLQLPEAVWADYLEAVLLTIHGWASWCAWLGWEACLAGRSDTHLRELLAIRMAWGVIVLECKDDDAASQSFDVVRARWSEAPRLIDQTAQALIVDELWQAAWEIAYQRELAALLKGACTLAFGNELGMGESQTRDGGRDGQSALPSADEVDGPDSADSVHAFFCIDVRSEPFRRALEAAGPWIRTSGFAGFFGLPIAYTPLATTLRRPQLPGLLAPAIEVVDTLEPAGQVEAFGRAHAILTASSDAAPDRTEAARRSAALARERNFASDRIWDTVTRWPGASFSFVEAAGVAYVGKLLRWVWPSRADRARDDLHGLPARYQSICRPSLSGVGLEQRVDLAERVLRATGLVRGFARLILWVGHGSQSANNAQAAALDCGACGGQTGEVNARVLARLLNEGSVRAGLQSRGIDIPEATVFVAMLHNTTTDEIEVFDRDALPDHAQTVLERSLAAFAQAGDQVRRWRAPSLDEDALAAPDRLLERFRRRSNDGAQTRPEWGLAGNAAFIIAPRARTRGIPLDGRCFLHDYESGLDEDGSLLELLMTAPMLVTHWINWQYHASTCEPRVLGSGNKVLHNVVGGHIGVFEGNGGDLRIGLARQSVDDGLRAMHEPLRLTVIIDAPAERIERVSGAHSVVHDLIENGWLHLWRWDGDRFLRRHGSQWLLLPDDLHAPRHH